MMYANKTRCTELAYHDHDALKQAKALIVDQPSRAAGAANPAALGMGTAGEACRALEVLTKCDRHCRAAVSEPGAASTHVHTYRKLQPSQNKKWLIIGHIGWGKGTACL
eukprot:1147169-Pelagomonas_calceolata.AAC.3